MSTKPLAHQVMPGAGDAESAGAAEGAVRARDSLFHWSGTADAISQTAKDDQKRLLLDAYFGAVAEESVEPAARYFAGEFFVRREPPTPPVQESIVADAIRKLTRINVEDVRDERSNVDLASVAATAFAGRLPSGVAVSEVAEWGNELERSAGTDAEGTLVREMLARVSSLEARYLVKLITGKLGAVVDRSYIVELVERRGSLPSAGRRADRRQQGGSKVDSVNPARRRRRRAP